MLQILEWRPGRYGMSKRITKVTHGQGWMCGARNRSKVSGGRFPEHGEYLLAPGPPVPNFLSFIF